MKIISTDCIPNYPDENLPTLLVYKGGQVKENFVGLQHYTMGGLKTCTPEGGTHRTAPLQHCSTVALLHLSLWHSSTGNRNTKMLPCRTLLRSFPLLPSPGRQSDPCAGVALALLAQILPPSLTQYSLPPVLHSFGHAPSSLLALSLVQAWHWRCAGWVPCWRIRTRARRRF